VIDNNASERALRGVAVGRKNWLFAGSDDGGRRAATLYSLIESAKRTGVEPWAYLRELLVRIDTHSASRIAELMPCRWKPTV
jgi:transposase